MTDILSLIDHAIEDYGTSDDAMRWLPEPDLAGFVRAAIGVELLPWQIEVARPVVSATPLAWARAMADPAFGRPARGLHPHYFVVDEVARLFGVPVSFLLRRPAAAAVKVRVRPRVRAMHCAYSRRLRARRRRRR